jgi:NAD(P)-dependent dehydrogenase (short-subunit alcohol dehydrogenase family)
MTTPSPLLKWWNGKPKPFPDDAWNAKDGPPAQRWICVQSVVVDDQDALWVLDSASPKTEAVVKGGPKLVKIDLATNKVRQTISLDENVAPEQGKRLALLPRAYREDDVSHQNRVSTERHSDQCRVCHRKDSISVFGSYAAAKFGVVGLDASLRQELDLAKLTDIHVCTVMPLATPFSTTLRITLEKSPLSLHFTMQTRLWRPLSLSPASRKKKSSLGEWARSWSPRTK